METERILQEVLERVTPSPAERKREAEMAAQLMKKLRKFKIKPMLVGSLAKETDLRGDKDIDIFMVFPQSVTREDLERLGLDYGKRLFKELKAVYEIDYAEHPYVKGRYNNYTIEVVPCYSGKTIMCSVDRTPLHTAYIKRELKKNPKLRAEIRLLKQFMKGCNVYGAESKIEGFSGYLTELLGLHHGSFLKVLEASSDWKFGHVIDHERHWENPEDLKYFFTGSDLIVVDPVDKDRNVAAAVSRQKLAEFIVASKEFLDSPKVSFFFPSKKAAKSVKELEKALKSRGTRSIALVLKHGYINENSLYSQLRRTLKSVVNEISGEGFSVMKSDFWTDENKLSAIVLEFNVWELPNVVQHMGPPIDRDVENQERFREIYSRFKPYIKGGHWVVDKKRKYTIVDQLVPKIVRERKGFGKDLRSARIVVRKDNAVINIDGEDYKLFLDRFI
ncbi:MAG: CCA tRNA nucleotidyltransferase [Candidatus Altiarchaeota archaeon]